MKFIVKENEKKEKEKMIKNIINSRTELGFFTLKNCEKKLKILSSKSI